MNTFGLYLKRCLRCKKNIFLLLILIICFVISISSFEIYQNLNQYLNDLENNNLDFRTIVLESEIDLEFKNVLKNSPHVLKIIPSVSAFVTLQTKDFEKIGLDGSVEFLIGGESISPRAVLGSPIKNNTTGGMLCPYHFYPNSSLEFSDKKEFYNPNELLNKEYDFKYYSFSIENNTMKKKKEYTKKLKLIGFYDNTVSHNLANQCYMSYEDLKEITGNIYQDMKDNTKYNDIILVDNVSHVSEILTMIHQKGYNASIKTIFKNDIIKNIKLVLKILIVLSVIVSCSLVLSYLYKEIATNKRSYQLKFSLGYSKLDIIKSQFLEFFPVFVFALFIGISLYFSLFFFIKFFIMHYMNHLGFLVNPKISNLLFVLLISIVLPCVLYLTFLYSYFSKNNSISFLEKREE